MDAFSQALGAPDRKPLISALSIRPPPLGWGTSPAVPGRSLAFSSIKCSAEKCYRDVEGTGLPEMSNASRDVIYPHGQDNLRMATREKLEIEKRAAANAAVEEIESGMIVGLGTGSTAAHAIEALAERCRGGLSVRTVATSLRTEAQARQAGLEIISFADLPHIDLCIDGVDEIDPDLKAIKGAGGAMLREKIVAQAAVRMVGICDSSKPVRDLSRGPLPLEVLPFARAFVIERIRQIGGHASLRKTRPSTEYLTDQANMVIDCAAPPNVHLVDFVNDLRRIPGVLADGLFVDEIDAIYIGQGTLAQRMERP